mmetsp:Transcript_2550/g.6933  ORF Transcript_2550/g.6933 Transcript_2550/m.6933 type:complete len:252 (-) Transcript_2550:227-982(-)
MNPVARRAEHPQNLIFLHCLAGRISEAIRGSGIFDVLHDVACRRRRVPAVKASALLVVVRIGDHRRNKLTARNELFYLLVTGARTFKRVVRLLLSSQDEAEQLDPLETSQGRVFAYLCADEYGDLLLRLVHKLVRCVVKRADHGKRGQLRNHLRVDESCVRVEPPLRDVVVGRRPCDRAGLHCLQDLLRRQEQLRLDRADHADCAELLEKREVRCLVSVRRLCRRVEHMRGLREVCRQRAAAAHDRHGKVD